jgi:hypothetical protein
MNAQDFTAACKAEFSRSGFANSPLSDAELADLFWLDYATVDYVYRVGCDVNSGFTLGEAMEANR